MSVTDLAQYCEELRKLVHSAEASSTDVKVQLAASKIAAAASTRRPVGLNAGSPAVGTPGGARPARGRGGVANRGVGRAPAGVARSTSRGRRRPTEDVAYTATEVIPGTSLQSGDDIAGVFPTLASLPTGAGGGRDASHGSHLAGARTGMDKDAGAGSSTRTATRAAVSRPGMKVDAVVTKAGGRSSSRGASHRQHSAVLEDGRTTPVSVPATPTPPPPPAPYGARSTSSASVGAVGAVSPASGSVSAGSMSLPARAWKSGLGSGTGSAPSSAPRMASSSRGTVGSNTVSSAVLGESVAEAAPDTNSLPGDLYFSSVPSTRFPYVTTRAKVPLASQLPCLFRGFLGQTCRGMPASTRPVHL